MRFVHRLEFGDGFHSQIEEEWSLDLLSFFFFLIRFGWGSLLRWVCVGSGWVYCFGFVVDS